ncbi:replication-relaxation family protein [Paractinoplanes globisporus]|uniref:Replication-relaxation family protein n=1 Tax=Paractinoplanes globisporus TaxID=113565 RepID=A0ABW6W5A4_9ACTN|nr:replication-relaxation family protein [Actinoplanes globisporus]
MQVALTGRHLVLLGWLADHGVLTAEQIAAALFPSVDFAQRRLRRC